jgi:hypothetical protein
MQGTTGGATILEDRLSRNKPEAAASDEAAQHSRAVTGSEVGMPVKLAKWRAVPALFGLVLTMQPAAALHRVHHRHQADGIVRSRHVAASPAVHYDDTPSYDDPSKYGGGTALSVRTESSIQPSTETSAAAVHVQPRSTTFTPNSNEEKAVQKRITDFNEMQRLQEESFDRKLVICRGC